MTETNPEKSKVAAIYVRVSTDKQDVTNQLLQLRPYCEKAGYLIYNEYVDVVSGCEDSRPAFNQLFKDAHQRKFDVLVFWSLDRFSRSGIKFTLLKLTELDNLKIGWDSYQEPYFRTIGPFGEALIGIIATIAKIERDRLSDRTKAGLARKRATGWVPGRKKGVKDKKPRRRKGYYDNTNWAGDKQRGTLLPRPKPPIKYVHEANKTDPYLKEQTPLSQEAKEEVKQEEIEDWSNKAVAERLVKAGVPLMPKKYQVRKSEKQDG